MLEFLASDFEAADRKCQQRLQTANSVSERKALLLLRLRIAVETGKNPRDVLGVITREFGPVELMPDDVLIPCIICHIRRKEYQIARELVERRLACQSDEQFDQLISKSQPELSNYEKMVELYVLHVLPHLQEWESAKEFLNFNDVLDDKLKNVRTT
ncbi:hypothetical protein HK101_003366 [Irineochytrium annulatum]|nr:hypothetical protein HK101_003366 [Irineochytrium annulatum]